MDWFIGHDLSRRIQKMSGQSSWLGSDLFVKASLTSFMIALFSMTVAVYWYTYWEITNDNAAPTKSAYMILLNKACKFIIYYFVTSFIWNTLTLHILMHFMCIRYTFIFLYSKCLIIFYMNVFVHCKKNYHYVNV